jgi:hypothetical protein
MLPAGLVAQLAERAEHHQIRALHPDAQTVVRLLVGACSCDLVRARHSDPREDERHHRDRHRKAGGARDALIAAIERHRRGAAVRPPPGGWPRALAAFVAEHARNAGPTLYLLRFGAGAPSEVGLGRMSNISVKEVAAAEVVARPETWLEEEAVTLVQR